MFWDEPETNLNPRLIRVLAQCIVALADQGIQVFLATHSLFLLRELDMLTATQTPTEAGPPATRFFAVRRDQVLPILEQGNRPEDLQTLVLLDEELEQSGRFMDGGA